MYSFLRKHLVTATVATFGLCSVASAVSFTYSSNEGAFINFNGLGAFSFTTTPNSFDVTSGSAIALEGDITGTFTIGAPVGFSAPVTGTGSFQVFDGANTLSATLVWNDITQIGAGGGLNILTASVNMSNITYGGVNADLVALRNDGSGINTLTFQFSTPYTLEQLRTTALTNSFSGTVASVATPVPDAGGSIALLGLGLLSIAALRRKFLA